MKKKKGGAKSESIDDARARFKHLSLLQDFQELRKGTEIAVNRLQNVKEKKLTLEAEVRFLRQRYNLLLKVRAQSRQKKQETALPQKLQGHSNKSARDKNMAMNGVAVRPPVPKFEYSQKGKVHKKRVTTPSMQKLSLSIDLNQNITKFNVPDSASRRVHQLDLNQIANDDDDFQPSVEPVRIEASAFGEGLTDEQLNDMKLSACRNIGNASSSRAGFVLLSSFNQISNCESMNMFWRSADENVSPEQFN